MANDRATSANLDLKWYLTARVAAVAVFCFLIAAAVALAGTYRDARRANGSVAEIAARQLENQLFRIQSDTDVTSRFPDWDTVADVALNPGQCLRYLRPDGSVGRSSCLGYDPAAGGPPAWLSWIVPWLLTGGADVARPISYRGVAYGTVLVQTEREAALGSIWRDVSGLLGLTALLTAALCLLQHWAIGRALRPTREILAGLDRLARGDLSCRLPGFRLIELERISQVFNALAASLDRTMREKAALAARLVEGQEQERLRLARDLHDELAQNLSAVSALAASIKATAETECAALAPEADRLSRTAAAVMKSLRGALSALRPPEIDDLGLAGGLQALAMEQELRSGGRLRVSLEIDGDLGVLSPTASSHVYRIVQEGLTNIVKHAEAAEAHVALGFLRDASGRLRSLAVTIEDDGAADAFVPANATGLGLIGMRERVAALGGELAVGPRAERGFRLRATIPANPQAEP